MSVQMRKFSLLILSYTLFATNAHGSNFSQFFSAAGNVEKEIISVVSGANAYPACTAGYTAHSCARGNGATLSASSGKFTGKLVYALSFFGTMGSYQALYISPDYVSTFATSLQLKSDGMNTTLSPIIMTSYNSSTYVTTYNDWGFCFCKEN
ncbi:MAG: hypothetical protein H7061_00140 [Bdellovibrionaceae bacterium]|nr:hypothetical protein [Bdellovibrio sp.]